MSKGDGVTTVVGHGLGSELSDDLAGDIIQTEILPEFSAGNLPRGIGRGLDRIARIARGDAAAAPISSKAAADNEVPSLWIIGPFLGLFVTLGTFVTGLGARTRASSPG